MNPSIVTKTFVRFVGGMLFFGFLLVLEAPRPAVAQDVRAADQMSLPGDWAYNALRDLVQRYNCKAGYVGSVLQKNLPLTRFEAAMAVNACANSVDDPIASPKTRAIVDIEDIRMLDRLQEEFGAELGALGVPVESLEGRAQGTESSQWRGLGRIAFEIGGEASFDSLTLPNQRGATSREVFGTPTGSAAVPDDRSDTIVGVTARVGFYAPPIGGYRPRVRLTGGALKAEKSDFTAVIPSNGEDLALASPQGPDAPSGGSVLVIDGGFGFADIFNASASSEITRYFGKLVVDLAEIYTEFPLGQKLLQIRPYAGMEVGAANTEARLSGQTFAILGSPTLDFSLESDVDDIQVGVIGGIGFTLPLAKFSNSTSLLVNATLEGGVAYHDQDGSSRLLTEGTVTTDETQDLQVNIARFVRRLQTEFRIDGPCFGIAGGVSVESINVPGVRYRTDAPATIVNDTETVVTGRLRMTFDF